MRIANSNAILSAFFLFAALMPSAIFAHSTGVYAGIYIIDMEAKPLSPFVGEKINFSFRIYDLRYQFIQESLKVAVEIIDPDKNTKLFGTQPVLITDGKFATEFTFPRDGIFSIVVNVWKPNEPDIIRDGAFAMQVRSAPQTTFGALVSGLVMGIIGSVLAFLSLRLMRRKLKKKIEK